MSAARAAYKKRAFVEAHGHFERAHILGQRYFLTHATTHIWMLRAGFARKDFREVTGQIVRLIAVVPGYLTGWVPKGNPGGAQVNAMRPMPIPAEFGALLSGHSVKRDVIARVAVLTAALVIGSAIWLFKR